MNMKNGYKSLHHSFRFTPYQLSEMCQMYANGQSFREIGQAFDVSDTAIEGYILKHYVGVIPKENQIKIIIQSKINEENGERTEKRC